MTEPCINIIAAMPDKAVADRVSQALLEAGLAAAVHIRPVETR